MSRALRRSLSAALRQDRPGGWWETTAVLRLPHALTATVPVWSPGPGYVQALTATVWACPSGGRLTHAVVVTAGTQADQRVIKSGPVTGENVMGCGGLTDKPHRIAWLAETPPVTWPAGDAHPALSYQDWVGETEQNLDRGYGRLLRARHLHGGQVRLRATPGGGFQATVGIEIEAGAHRRYDITAHAAALASLIRRLDPGTRLRFHPGTARHAVNPLDAHAWKRLVPAAT